MIGLLINDTDMFVDVCRHDVWGCKAILKRILKTLFSGGERKSLYLSYSLDSNKTSNKIFPPVDGQNKPSFPSSHSNFVLKQRKETVNSSHVETKANPVMKSDISSDDIQTKESGYDNKRKKYLYSTYSEQNQDGNYERSGVYHKFPGGKGYCRNSKPLFAAVGFQNSCGSEHEEESHKMNYENHFKTAGQELVCLLF